ncbi:hypothetical protein CSIM01_11212 [Colletotrichum simmondsii]|uniref:Uncharacterized protein n=1 Tax=Colletotrichum simmondsii TaxID=703756 RepID=A0A135TCU1_9PEZI|nr:hypothetical protein CSIM01_11212 [Colletotrichum simmondsii]
MVKETAASTPSTQVQQGVNRLAWADESFGTTKLDDYHLPQTERRGHFYTFIAVLARSLSEKDYEVLFDKWSYILPEVAKTDTS